MPGTPTPLTHGATGRLATGSAAAWGSGSCTWPMHARTEQLRRYTKSKTNPGHATRSWSVHTPPLPSNSEHQAVQPEFWVQQLNPAAASSGKHMTLKPCSVHDFCSPSLKQCKCINIVSHSKVLPQIQLHRGSHIPFTVLSLHRVLPASTYPWLETSPEESGHERKAERVHGMRRSQAEDACGSNIEKSICLASRESKHTDLI